MIAIGYDSSANALVIAGSNVFPAGSLIASLLDGGILRVASLAGRVEYQGPWQNVCTLAGTAFASANAAVAYLTAECAKSQAQQAYTRPPPITTVAATTGPQTIPVALLTGSALLSINGALQSPDDFTINGGEASLPADLLVTAGDRLMFIPL